MPDTVRTIATILQQLSDNNTGLITPQKVRDAVMTLFPDFGLCYSVTDDFNGSLPYTDPNTFVPIDCDQAMPQARNFDLTVGATKALRYIGTAKRTLIVFAYIQASSGASRSMKIIITKNGVGITTGIGHFITTPSVGGVPYETTIFGITEVVTNDVIKVALANADGGGNIAVALQSQEILALALPAFS